MFSQKVCKKFCFFKIVIKHSVTFKYCEIKKILKCLNNISFKGHISLCDSRNTWVCPHIKHFFSGVIFECNSLEASNIQQWMMLNTILKEEELFQVFVLLGQYL